jgi:hypothetical protein
MLSLHAQNLEWLPMAGHICWCPWIFYKVIKRNKKTYMSVEDMVPHVHLCIWWISKVFSAAVSACNGSLKCGSAYCVYNEGSTVLVCVHALLSYWLMKHTSFRQLWVQWQLKFIHQPSMWTCTKVMTMPCTFLSRDSSKGRQMKSFVTFWLRMNYGCTCFIRNEVAKCWLPIPYIITKDWTIDSRYPQND